MGGGVSSLLFSTFTGVAFHTGRITPRVKTPDMLAAVLRACYALNNLVLQRAS